MKSWLKSINSLEIFLLTLIFASFIIKLFSAYWYPIQLQHDPHLHIQIFKKVGQIETYKSYNSFFYYALVHIFSFPLWFLKAVDLISFELYLKISVAWSNTLILLITSILTYKVFDFANLQRPVSLLGVLLLVSNPVIQRSFSMLRPENLLILLIISIIYLIMKYDLNSKLTYLKLSVVIATLAVIQKITGVISFLLIAITFLYKKKYALSYHDVKSLLIITVFGFVVLGTTNYFISNSNPLAHHANQMPDYKGRPTIDQIVSIDIMKQLENPTRTNRKKSLSLVLLSDFFGDFWRYGSSHYFFANFKSNYNNVNLWLNRIGYLFSLLTFILIIILIVIHFKDKPNLLSWLFLLLTIGMLLLLILASFKYTNPKKLDTFKWEYILPVILLIYYPCLRFISTIRNSNRFCHNILFGYLIIISLWGLFMSFPNQYLFS